MDQKLPTRIDQTSATVAKRPSFFYKFYKLSVYGNRLLRVVKLIGRKDKVRNTVGREELNIEELLFGVKKS